MRKNKISGAELARLMSSFVGVGNTVVCTFFCTYEGFQRLSEPELMRRLESVQVAFEAPENQHISYEEGCVSSTDGEAICGYVTFDSNSVIKIIDSKGSSSVADNGALKCSVNFSSPMGEYIYSIVVSEKLRVSNVKMGSDALDIEFDRPYSGVIKVVFFKKVAGLDVS